MRTKILLYYSNKRFTWFTILYAYFSETFWPTAFKEYSRYKWVYECLVQKYVELIWVYLDLIIWLQIYCITIIAISILIIISDSLIVFILFLILLVLISYDFYLWYYC